jgi:hypothetical protein
MNCRCRILVERAQHRLTISALCCRLQRVVVVADACQRGHLPSKHCIRGNTAWQCRLAGRAQMLEMVESIWCAGAGVVPTIDCATSAWRSSRRVRQHSLRCITTHLCRVVGRAQMSHNVDSFWRALQCRPSMSPPVHGGAAVVCAMVAYDIPLLAVVMFRDERRCRTMSTRRGAQWTTYHRPRRPCTVAPPPCAPRLPTMYQYSLLLFGWTRTDFGQCRLVEARCSVDHRPRRPCTVAPSPCAPRLPTMYQYLLLSCGGTSADVGQCRPVEARGAVSPSSLAASARRCRGTIEMHNYTYVCIK